MEELASTDQHNARLFESAEDYPPNIDPAKNFSARYVIEDDYVYPGQTSLQEAIQYRLDKQNVKGVRKNSRVALEYVLAVNDQTAWENYSPSGFFAEAEKWIEERHGKGCVVHVAEHYDESNPHMHIVVVPVIKKEVRFKNRFGEGTRTEVRLNTSAFTDGGDKLRQLQDDYHQFVKGFEQKFGVTFYRGTYVENQTRQYVQQTDHRIGRVRAIIQRFEREFPHLLERVRNSIKKRIKALKSHLFGLSFERDVSSAALEQEIKRKRDQNKKGKWKSRGPKGDQLNNPIKEHPPSPKASEERTEKNKGNGNQFGM